MVQVHAISGITSGYIPGEGDPGVGVDWTDSMNDNLELLGSIIRTPFTYLQSGTPAATEGQGWLNTTNNTYNVYSNGAWTLNISAVGLRFYGLGSYVGKKYSLNESGVLAEEIIYGLGAVSSSLSSVSSGLIATNSVLSLVSDAVGSGGGTGVLSQIPTKFEYFNDLEPDQAGTFYDNYGNISTEPLDSDLIGGSNRFGIHKYSCLYGDAINARFSKIRTQLGISDIYIKFSLFIGNLTDANDYAFCGLSNATANVNQLTYLSSASHNGVFVGWGNRDGHGNYFFIYSIHDTGIHNLIVSAIPVVANTKYIFEFIGSSDGLDWEMKVNGVSAGNFTITPAGAILFPSDYFYRFILCSASITTDPLDLSLEADYIYASGTFNSAR